MKPPVGRAAPDRPAHRVPSRERVNQVGRIPWESWKKSDDEKADTATEQTDDDQEDD